MTEPPLQGARCPLFVILFYLPKYVLCSQGVAQLKDTAKEGSACEPLAITKTGPKRIHKLVVVLAYHVDKGKKVWIVKVDHGKGHLVEKGDANIVERPKAEPDTVCQKIG